MELDRRMGRTRTRTAAAPDRTLAPGKCTLTEQLPVQQREAATPRGAEHDASGTVASAPLPPRASGPTLQMLFGVRPAPAEDPAQVHAAAERGTATAATTLPHAGQIQRAFGRHDISRIQAHASGEAAASAREMGARAYAAGDHVVLGEDADLHTVAHEAAHVIQQRGGVRLERDMGRPGDPHEQHADAVASAVVAGSSAEALLDRYVAGGAASASPTAAVQHTISFAGVGGSPVLIAEAIRRAFASHGRELRKLHPHAGAVLAAIAAPADLPRVIQEMMQADRNFGHYDLECWEHLEKLFVLLRARLPWNKQRRITKKAKLRDGAKAELRDDPSRVPLTTEEDRSIGYAQLPLLEFFHRSDQGTPGFRSFDAEERTAHMYTFDRGKLMAVASRNTHLRTRDAEMSSADRYQAFTEVAAAMGLSHDDPALWQREDEINREIDRLGAMMIYVMNAGGDMFVARSGRPEAGIELLMREIAREPSGRGRFQRRIQLAELCLGAGNAGIAVPILQVAAAEIEEKKLEAQCRAQLRTYLQGGPGPVVDGLRLHTL